MSTFSEVFRFELRYRCTRHSTWIFTIAIVGLTWLMVGETLLDEAKGSGVVQANAPGLIAALMAVMSMVLLPVTATVFGDAAARDLETGMHPLVFTSPLQKSGYLGGRFAAAFVINALLLAIVPIGLAFVELHRGAHPELLGPFRASAFIYPYLILMLPTLLATGSILFVLAALTGRSFSSYVGGAFLFFGALAAEEILAEGLQQGLIGTLLEPFGFTALSELAEYWTPFEQNTRLVPLTGPLLWNRLIWLGIAVLLLIVAYRRFRLTEPAMLSSKRKSLAVIAEHDVRLAEMPVAPRTFGLAACLHHTLGIARRSLADGFGNRVSLAVAGLAWLLVGLAGLEGVEMFLETPTWPMTYLVTREVLGNAGPLILLLMTIFTGELVWRERSAGVNEIVDAFPLPNWVTLAGKYLALGAALAIFQLALIGAAIGGQAIQRYYDFDILLYLKIVFGIQWPELMLWAALAMLVHVAVNHKYVAHFLFILYWAFATFGRRFFEIEDNLLVFTAAPRWSYSELSGFEPFFGPWLAFKMYWAAWAALFLVVATALWVRGKERRIRWTMTLTKMAVASSLAIALTGGFVFYNTHILNEYRSTDDRSDVRAGYERRYKRHQQLPQPLITRCDLQIELYPQRRQAEIRGVYRLQNQTTQPIRSVHLLLHEDVDLRTISFQPAARRTLNDERTRYQIFELARPLLPGQSAQMRFELAFAPRGFENGGAQSEVVANGTYFNREWMPVIGYQPELELLDRQEREERGLPARNRLPSMSDPDALRVIGDFRDSRWQHFEVVIGTDPDQIALAPGSLRRTWTASGRRYYHYASDAPIQNKYAIYSAKYAVRSERWRDVDIEIYHHPRHSPNLERMAAAMKATLEYHTAHFGPYPHRQLRIVEFPRHAGTYARAYPNTIAFSEGFGFMARTESGIDYPFLVAAHEVAHQWWGNQLRPARVEGGPVLAETLAHYGAMMVSEKVHGRGSLDDFRRMLRHKYLVGRQNRRSTEVPLLLSNDQEYIHYDKGAVVMYALRESIGEDRLNSALRRLLEKHRFGQPPYPTTRDFYAELKAVTPPEHLGLLKDLIEDITLWELRAKDPRVVRDAGGAYRVTFTVEAQKIKADSIGRDRRVPMNDLVEVGVFAGREGDDLGQPLYLKQHRIRSGEQTITITVPRQPTRVGIDPRQMLIERELTGEDHADNVVDVKDQRRSEE